MELERNMDRTNSCGLLCCSLILLSGRGKSQQGDIAEVDVMPRGDWVQFADTVRTMGGKVKKGSADYSRWLSDNQVPEEIRVGLVQCALEKMVGIGAIRIYSEKDIVSCNSKGGIPIALKHGLLIVGTCPNGDPVAIDLKEKPGVVGYIMAETMWSVSDVRTVFIPVAQTLGEFVAKLSKDQMPLDYFEAKETQQKSKT